ncbi:MAG: extracellular solute-binding protein [Alphaproteobacteria bacterium]|nr:extracellular solute-binding protein [Alphaproteobacteria bacterium]
MHAFVTTRRNLAACLTAGAIAAWAGAAAAQGLEDKLVIVTSFPKDLYAVYAAAFEKKHPGTKVEVLNKGSTAGIAYVRETAAKPPDLFWASAPDAFEVLKGQKLLQKYQPKAQGIPDKVGAYPINDPDGFYLGFAASGYGIMYNTRYLQAKKLPAPKEWDDLKKPIYAGHVAISAPSRSGTTHLTIETILQGEGWDKGWATNLELAGNYAAVTERSFGVPEGVNNGQYGLGIVIDFFGFSAKASGFPVDFVYPTITTLVPANIGMIANAPNARAATAFIEFVLSPEGQELLFDHKIRRLPVLTSAYTKAPEGYPNPFKDSSIGRAVKFDSDVSELRYEMVNSLYDQLITFRLPEVRAAWSAIHAAEAALAKKPHAEAANLVRQARQRATQIPVTAAQATDRGFVSTFKEKVKDKPVEKRQAEIEEEWAQFARKNYAEAKQLADRAAGLAK